MSTGTSRIPNANSDTHAAVLRPTPGSDVRYSCASGTGWPANQSSERSPGAGAPEGRGCSVIPCRIDLIRADFTLLIPPGRIASSIRSTGASRIASQSTNRSRNPKYATSRLRSFVDWDSTVRISSAIGWPWGLASGIP